jgi:hypothetical protein
MNAYARSLWPTAVAIGVGLLGRGLVVAAWLAPAVTARIIGRRDLRPRHPAEIAALRIFVDALERRALGRGGSGNLPPIPQIDEDTPVSPITSGLAAITKQQRLPTG